MLRSCIRSYSQPVKAGFESIPYQSAPINKYNQQRSPFNFKPAKQEGSPQLIHNPPQAINSLKHTPKKFLPANDPRHALPIKANQVYTKQQLDDMPLISEYLQKKTYTLTPEIVEKIQKLRNEDPSKWTIRKIARELDIDIMKVNVLSGINKSRQVQVANEIGEQQIDWSEKKLNARNDRKKRTEMWLRGEY